MNDTIQKQHYFLITGCLMFTLTKPDGTLTADTTMANAIVRHDSTDFPAYKLGKAQQNLHRSFVMKLPEEARQAMQFHDVVITNISYLGLMSEDEFQYQPPVNPFENLNTDAAADAASSESVEGLI